MDNFSSAVRKMRTRSGGSTKSHNPTSTMAIGIPSHQEPKPLLTTSKNEGIPGIIVTNNQM
jgi:hypothetical protein